MTRSPLTSDPSPAPGASRGQSPRHRPGCVRRRPTIQDVPYPSRPVLDVLPQFANDAKTRWVPEEIARLDAFVAERYRAGHSIHQLAELTGRTQMAIRRSLDRTGTPRRGRGAQPLQAAPGTQDTDPAP